MWKPTSFLRQDAHGLDVWRLPYVQLRVPMITNLRMDPLERAEYEAIDYDHWYIDHAFLIAPAANYIGQWLQSFREYPPRQEPGSFNLERVMKAITAGASGKGAN